MKVVCKQPIQSLPMIRAGVEDGKNSKLKLKNWKLFPGTNIKTMKKFHLPIRQHNSIKSGDLKRTYLVAVVAGILLLAAVPSDVTRPMTLVTAVLLLATLRKESSVTPSRAGCLNAHLSGKVAEPVALVALLASTSTTVAAAYTATSAATWRGKIN